MKKLFLAAALGLSAMGLAQAAGTATGTFDVAISLSSKCEVTSAPTASFTYTSFQTGAVPLTSSFNVRCTKSLPISGITLDSTTVTDAATELEYTLAVGTVPAAGTGSDQSIPLTGSMAGGQAGKCTTAICSNSGSANKQRTLTIAY